jgi:hypothetical protein
MGESISLDAAVEAITSGMLRALAARENQETFAKFRPDIWAGGRLAMRLPGEILKGEVGGQGGGRIG